MWGAKYQVVVTTHLNTDNIRNHFVINSVSFVDGRKFRNGIGDRLELRKISDTICAARNKSVIQSHKFYSNKRNIGYGTPASSPIGIYCGVMWMKHFPNAVPSVNWNITLNAWDIVLSVTSVMNILL